MDSKILEIPFGAKDLELYQFTYTIPDGYSAEIKDGKVIVKKKESEDERIRKAIGAAICGTTAETVLEVNGVKLVDALAYLEKQKEHKPLSTKETELNSIAFLEQLGYTCVPPGAEQKSAEWSEEDDALLREIVSFFKDGTVKLQHDLDLYAGFLEKKFKFLRPKPHWKPEVDLEKEIKEQWKKWDDIITYRAFASIARHFYELGQRTKYQQDRAEFAKLKTKEWQSGYDEGYAKGFNERKEEKYVAFQEKD